MGRTSDNKRSARYVLKLTPDEKASFDARAEAAGVPLAEVFRTGADRYLTEIEQTDSSPVMAEFYALARKIDHHIKGGS